MTTKTKRQAAEAFLRDLLAAGPVAVRQIQAKAKAAGVPWRAVLRAQVILRVEPHKAGFAAGWVWCLPAKTGRKRTPHPHTSKGETTMDDLHNLVTDPDPIPRPVAETPPAPEPPAEEAPELPQTAEITLLGTHPSDLTGGLVLQFARSAGHSPVVVHVATGGLVPPGTGLHPILAVLAGTPRGQAVNINRLIGMTGRAVLLARENEDGSITFHIEALLHRRSA